MDPSTSSVTFPSSTPVLFPLSIPPHHSVCLPNTTTLLILSSLPRSILLQAIKSYHEANCLFDELSMDLELKAFSRLSLRGEANETLGIYNAVWVCNVPCVGSF